MSKNDRQLQLIAQLRQTKDFLHQKTKTQPLDADLIQTLDAICDRLQADKKLTVKIISPSLTLATSLQSKYQANEQLRSLYEFETVAPIGNIRQILQECDLICLIYAPKHALREHHYKLIELAHQQNLALSILVQRSQRDRDLATEDRWREDLNALAERLLPLSSNYFIDLEDPESLDFCERSLIDLAPEIANNRPSRIANQVVREVKSAFNPEITSLWQAIKQINSQYCGDRPLHVYQQQLRQDIQTFNQFRQQQIRDIKQAVNHAKTDLLNPFAIDGLIFNFQQAIDPAEVKIVTEGDKTYLYFVLAQFPQQPFLHDYILELCQQRVDEILAEQWSKINFVYGSGGLKLIAERSQRELSKIEPLLDNRFQLIPLSSAKQPSLEVTQIIDPYCLKINSRILFDYSFTQSSWFRLFISTLVGTAIYLSTWLYFGKGRYIGFMIIIFQLINLITGQSIKKSRLKQQTKELKRVADQKYQSLIRTIVSYLAQTIITAIDRECQFYQQEYSQAIAIAQNKLDELKQTNETHKATIEQLKQDRDKIIAWFD